MKVIRAAFVACFLATPILVAGSGCGRISARSMLSPAQLALLRADSDVFETIARAELPTTKEDSSPRIHALRIDSDPNGRPSAFHDVAGGSRGLGAGDAEPGKDSTTMILVVRQRKAILKRLGFEEGAPFNYPQCSAMLGFTPHLDSSRADRYAKCPKEVHNYLTIGLPFRGVPENLKRMRRASGAPAPDLTGEVWTVVTSHAYAAAKGQYWSRSAVLLRRDPADGRLKLAETILLSWAE